MKYIIALLALGSIVVACGNPYEKKLLGKWQAVAVLENDTPMDINPEVIWFQFSPHQQYEYHGTLKYREAGSYYLESKYLHTIDTINQASTEKAVEITRLTDDSLFLRMSEGSKERIIKLVRID